MELEDFVDANKVNHRQMKRLTITGSRPPYKNKLIRIRIEFDDDYPKSPIKMFVEKTKGV
jgi:ubiquitin-protein ligase